MMFLIESRKIQEDAQLLWGVDACGGEGGYNVVRGDWHESED